MGEERFAETSAPWMAPSSLQGRIHGVLCKPFLTQQHHVLNQKPKHYTHHPQTKAAPSHTSTDSKQKTPPPPQYPPAPRNA